MKLNNTNFNSKIFQFKNSKLNQIKINFKNFNYEWQFNTNSMNIDPTQINEYFLDYYLTWKIMDRIWILLNPT